MTRSSVSPCPPYDEPPTGLDVLLAILKDWAVTLRLMVLLLIPIVAVVVIVALIVMHLGPVGAGALLTGAGGGYGIKRLLARRRRHR